MPIYLYRCEECGNEFDLKQRFSDEPIHSCRVCHGNVRRVIQNVPVLFKGSGFYVTDNRNGKSNGSQNGSGPKTTEDTEKPTKTENKEKSETKTETKTETVKPTAPKVDNPT